MNAKISQSDESKDTRSHNFYYGRGEDEREVRKELFLLEGQEGFDGLSLRGKMAKVINKGSRELQELFYDMGIGNELSKSC